MSRSYFTDDMKLVKPSKPLPLWTPQECMEVEQTLHSKGYDSVSVSVRYDHNGVLCNCWSVERDMVGFFVEELMKRRVIIEIEAKRHFRVDLLFVCRNNILDVKNWIKNIPKCKGDDSQ